MGGVEDEQEDISEEDELNDNGFSSNKNSRAVWRTMIMASQCQDRYGVGSHVGVLDKDN